MRLLTLSALATFLLASGTACANAAAVTPAYTVLDESASQLREDFNRAQGSVRLLFVVDPICPGCLRGLDDLNTALLAGTRDPRLQTFVVHVPVLKPPPQAKDVPRAGALLHNPFVHQYWNPTGAFGWELAKAVDLKGSGELVYAWDVWLIYGPEARWDGASPPKPRRLMHQLRALRGSKEFLPLDRDVFAREVRELLAQLPPAKATP